MLINVFRKPTTQIQIHLPLFPVLKRIWKSKIQEAIPIKKKEKEI